MQVAVHIRAWLGTCAAWRGAHHVPPNCTGGRRRRRRRRRDDSSAKMRTPHGTRRSALRAADRPTPGAHSAGRADKRWHASLLTIAKWNQARRYWQLSCITPLSQGCRWTLAPCAVSESHSRSIKVTHAHHGPPGRIPLTDVSLCESSLPLLVNVEDVFRARAAPAACCVRAGLSPPHLQSSDPLARRVWLVLGAGQCRLPRAASPLPVIITLLVASFFLPFCPPSLHPLFPPPPRFPPPSRLQARPQAARIYRAYCSPVH